MQTIGFTNRATGVNSEGVSGGRQFFGKRQTFKRSNFVPSSFASSTPLELFSPTSLELRAEAGNQPVSRPVGVHTEGPRRVSESIHICGGSIDCEYVNIVFCMYNFDNYYVPHI